MSSGWMCPKCGRVWAPHVDGCESCNLYPKTASGGFTDTYPNTYSSAGTSGLCPSCGRSVFAPAGSIGCMKHHYAVTYGPTPEGTK